MTDLSAEAVQAVDRRSMIADVLSQPAQLGDALWRVESAGVPRREGPGGMLVCGMGGSAIGGDLARACLGERALRPIWVRREYAPGPWPAGDPLVLCASYSGDTEETVACYEAAREAHAPRAVVTTGGRLAELAREDGTPVIGVPAGLQPRAAVVYMTVAALECAAACGAAPSVRHEIEGASGPLEALGAEWAPWGAGESEPKELARRLVEGLPVIYGAGSTAAPARRWKTQLNENAKVPAFFSELPEADHNEISGIKSGGGRFGLELVFLGDGGQDPHLERRLQLTAKIASEAGARVHRAGARGRTTVERVLSLVMLGDLVSLYAAVLRGVDPTPVDAIERFKRALSEG